MSSATLPFIGSLYSETSGQFSKISSLCLSTCDVHVTQAGLDIDFTLKEYQKGKCDGVHSHVVVGVVLNLQCTQSKNIGLTVNFRLKTLGHNIKTDKLEAHLCYPQLTITNYILMRLEHFKQPKTVVNSSVMPNKFAILFSNETFQKIEQFSEHLQKSLKTYASAEDFKNIFDIVQRRKEICQGIHTSICKMSHQNWFECLQEFNSILNQFDETVLSVTEVYETIKARTEEKSKAATPFVINGVQYLGSHVSLANEMTNNMMYYIMFISHDFDSFNQKQTCDFFMILHQSHKTIKICRFLVVDLDLYEGHLELERPQQPIVCCFQDGRCLSLDVQKDTRNQTDEVKCEEKDLGAFDPVKYSVVILPCPGSTNKGCFEEAREWLCPECKSHINYGFDEHFYCKCGKGLVKNYGFRCSDPKHGIGFDKLDMDITMPLLNKLLPVKEMNILLIGVAGVGKSTWINAVCNYMKYSSLAEAEKCEIYSVLPIHFCITNDYYKMEEIQVGNVESEQERRIHVFSYKNMIVNIIDTPSFGDINGFEKDKLNLKKIYNDIRQLRQLDAICVLLRPNVARLDPSFKFCFKELLTLLHKSVAQNILFCFPHTKSTNYRPGDTLPVLRKFIVDAKLGLILDKNHFYCLDNEAVRYLCILKHGKHVKWYIDQRCDYLEMWDHSTKEIQRLLEYVSTLTPHQVKETISLNDARQYIRDNSFFNE